MYRALRSFGICRSASTTILTIPLLREGGQCIRYCVEAKGFRTLSYEFLHFFKQPSRVFFTNLCKKCINTAKIRRQPYLLYNNFYILPPFFLNLKYLYIENLVMCVCFIKFEIVLLVLMLC